MSELKMLVELRALCHGWVNSQCGHYATWIKINNHESNTSTQHWLPLIDGSTWVIDCHFKLWTWSWGAKTGRGQREIWCSLGTTTKVFPPFPTFMKIELTMVYIIWAYSPISLWQIFQWLFLSKNHAMSTTLSWVSVMYHVDLQNKK